MYVTEFWKIILMVGPEKVIFIYHGATGSRKHISKASIASFLF